MADIIKFYPRGAAKNPDNVLEQAVGCYDQVFIIGYDKKGSLDVRASTNFTVADILLVLEEFKFKLLHRDYSVEECDA